MTITMFDLTYRVAAEIGGVFTSLATSGTTSTVVDTVNLQNAGYEDDHFNLGEVWLLRDAAGAGAAPEGERHGVTDFVQSTGTLITGTFAAAVDTGDKFAVVDRRLASSIIDEAVNQAIRDFDLITTDTSTITTANGQSEYTLPIALMDLRQVWIQRNTDDADDNLWSELSGWYVQKTATGSADTLVLETGAPDGYTLKLVYTTVLPDMNAMTDELDERVPEQLVIQKAVVNILMKWKFDPVYKDPNLNDMLNFHLDKLQRMEEKYTQKIPAKQGRIMLPWGAKAAKGRYGEYLG